MTAVTLPNVGITSGYLEDESGWGAAMNHNLRLTDALLHLRVGDKDLTEPIYVPTGGDAYIVAPGATGVWSGWDNYVAVWMVGDDLAGAWVQVQPKAGWKAYVVDETADYRFDGTAWAIIPVPGSGGGSVPGSSPVAVLDGTGSVLVDMTLGNMFTMALTGEVTDIIPINLAAAGATAMIRITQAAPWFAVTWPLSFIWPGGAPAISTGDGDVDLLTITTFNSGVTWLARLDKAFV